MKPGQQFKIDSIEELKEAYEKLSPWCYGLDNEIHDFISNNFRWLSYCKDNNGILLLSEEDEDYQTIPNPFKKYSWQRMKKALDELGYNNLEEEKDPIREELRVLREEVDKLKEKEVPDFIEGDNEICNWLNCKGEKAEILKEKQEAINKIHEIMRQSLATKECCKEKPKESEELKIKWNDRELTINSESGVILFKISNGLHCNIISISRFNAIKIVNYLKNHFEIKD